MLTAITAVAILAGPAALAENKASGPAKPIGKDAPTPKAFKWNVPDMDSDQSGMAKSKTAPKPAR
ncbi:MAG: hypothetical protein FJX20_06045 [Alphaproteobacteria bacterium]|nr:hypothetical protein [Alphaproteobacteria bacterium]